MFLVFHIFIVSVFFLLTLGIPDIFLEKLDKFTRKYGHFSEDNRKEMLEEAKKMFYFGYDNYMKYAYPMDELDPINCKGRGPDYANPSNININDALGDYSLTLVDALDTLAMMGNSSEFKRAVSMIINNLSFNKNTTVQVFEATIRLLGGLLSAHLIIKDPQQPFGDMVPASYESELLHLAHDLASRLLMAFENTATGIPFPRVNLLRGVLPDTINETCTAGAGTLLLEFGLLSRLLGDPVFDGVARRAIKAIWKYRSLTTGLVGNVIDIQTGKWVGKLSGLGAGLDSFYEYLLKAYIMFGEEEYYEKFLEIYSLIKQHMRRGRVHCNRGVGDHPLYVNINMMNGAVHTPWIDSLQAAFPGVQVLHGDIEEAICAHAIYYSIWQRYGALPERYNWQHKVPEISFYPLRPELVESTYLLYQATKNPFYLHVGRDILYSLNNHTKVACGYATIHDVEDKSLEDRMESFFLSETCKYLYLLFDKDNPLNKNSHGYILNTEGHIFPMDWKFRKKPWETHKSKNKKKVVTEQKFPINSSFHNCLPISDEQRYVLPIRSTYLRQIFSAVGVEH